MTTDTKTVAFVNLKGGVGKTTSAIGTAEALARLGHTVTVRDADPSGAATLWAHKALSAGRPLPFGVEVVNRFTVAAPAEEEWVLIDTPPLQTDLVEAAVDAADLVLLVTTTGPIDLERMLETIRQINKPSSVLLTQTRYGTRSLRHAEEFLAEKLPKITVELDPMLKKRFKAEAVRRGTTIRDMLTAWIERDCPPLDAADARAEAKQDGRRSG